MSAVQTSSAHVISEEVVHRGKWVSFKLIHYRTPDGVERTWEAYERTLHSEHGRDLDTVEVLPILHRKGQPPCVVLVSQFRPAAGQVCVELPGGLIDAGEDAVTAGRRELLEETGYTASGPVRDWGPVVYNGGSSNTVGKLLLMHIDGDDPRNHHPKPHCDDGEFTTVHVVPLHRLDTILSDLQSLGLFLEARLATLVSVLSMFGSGSCTAATAPQAAAAAAAAATTA